MLRLIYRSLLRLHPAGFRRRFSEEMLSIFDEVEQKGSAAKLVADGFTSFGRQWLLRAEYWEDKGTERLHPAADGVPVFYILQSSAPRTSALINGAILTLLMFCGVCLVLKYNWTHPVDVHISGVQFEVRSEDLPPGSSATLSVEGKSFHTGRPMSPEPMTNAQHQPIEPSSPLQPPLNSPVTSQFEAAATPHIQPQATSVTGVRNYSATQIAVRKPGTAQGEHQFATQLAIARFYVLHGNYPMAVAHYRLALKMRPYGPDATFGLAQSLENSGRTAEAQSSYRAYLKAAPNGRFAEQSKAALHRLEQSAPR